MSLASRRNSATQPDVSDMASTPQTLATDRCQGPASGPVANARDSGAREALNGLVLAREFGS